jgi:hypothetical protein
MVSNRCLTHHQCSRNRHQGSDEGYWRGTARLGYIIRYVFHDQLQAYTSTDSAARLVAGVIATHLNYDPPPWDGSLTGKARVQAIKDYIQSDGSSWIRKGDINTRAIWNGATRTDHNSAGANQCLASKKRQDCNTSSPSSPPALQPTKALSIILQNYIDEIQNSNA